LKKFLWARDERKVPSIISISLLGGVPGVEGYGRGTASHLASQIQQPRLARDQAAAINGRRFPPSWTVEEQEACFVMRGALDRGEYR
jgi:hypothetical protein